MEQKTCNPHLHPLPLEAAQERQDFIPQYCNSVLIGKDLEAASAKLKWSPFQRNHIWLLSLFAKWSPCWRRASSPREDKCVGVIVCNPRLSPALTADLHKCGRPLNSPPSPPCQPPSHKTEPQIAPPSPKKAATGNVQPTIWRCLFYICFSANRPLHWNF